MSALGEITYRLHRDASESNFADGADPDRHVGWRDARELPSWNVLSRLRALLLSISRLDLLSTAHCAICCVCVKVTALHIGM